MAEFAAYNTANSLHLEIYVILYRRWSRWNIRNRRLPPVAFVLYDFGSWVVRRRRAIIDRFQTFSHMS